jgi:hypothetical protein
MSKSKRTRQLFTAGAKKYLTEFCDNYYLIVMVYLFAGAKIKKNSDSLQEKIGIFLHEYQF